MPSITEAIAQFPAWFRTTQVGRDILAESQQKADAQRGELIQQRQALLNARAERLPSQQKALDDATRKRSAIEASLEKARAVEAVAASALRADSGSTERQAARIAADLQKSAPACLREFEDAVAHEIAQTREAVQSLSEPTGRFYDDKPELRWLSNRASIAVRLTALTADLHWVREQAFVECVTGVEAAPAIAARRATWPELKMEPVQ